MSNAWGTPSEHNKNVREAIRYERGDPIPDDKEPSAEPDKPEIPKVEIPTVVLPDGSTVPVDEYDPYRVERERIAADKTAVTLDGVVQFLKEGKSETTEIPKEEDKTPIFQPLVFDEDEIVNETDEKVVGHLNQFGQTTAEQLNGVTSQVTQLAENVNKFIKTQNGRNLDTELTEVSARTGFTREQLVAGNLESGIDDPAMVATYLAGKQQQETTAQEAVAKAEEERKRKAAGVTGTTGGGGNLITSDERNLPADLHRASSEEITKHFTFANPQ